MAALAMTPEYFACGISMFGPTNLITFLEGVPEYWGPVRDVFRQRIGDYTTPTGRKMLAERSPMTHVDNITKPLLIAQGANDVRVAQNESEQIVRALDARDVQVVYALYLNEGHGFVLPENVRNFFALAEIFLSTNLGGRAEPIGSELELSSVKVRATKSAMSVFGDRIPGLSCLSRNPGTAD